MELIEQIKRSFEVEIREDSQEDEYFEAVFKSDNMDALAGVLANYLGEPQKTAGEVPRFSFRLRRLIKIIGGIRQEQTFYIKEDKDNFIFAAIWPWQSDTARSTLKIGWGNFSEL